MSESTPTAEQVRAWLLEHPDFLASDAELLAQLAVPHESGAPSLLERQVGVLRSENQRLKRQLEYLNGVAGENERLMQRLHRLSLTLLASDGPAGLIEALDQGLRSEFGADAVRILMLDSDALPAAGAQVARLEHEAPAWLGALLEAGTPSCGRLTRSKRELIFGDDAEAVGSAALIPVGRSALLAIGSHSDQRFHPDMGTLFLELLGQTLGFGLELSGDPAAQRCAEG